MKRCVWKIGGILLATALLWLSFGCGWDSTPQYVIATPPGVTATPFARWTASPVPEGFETPTPEPTQEPEDTNAPDASAAGTGDASATPASATPDPSASGDPLITPTPDPYLIGKWEFKRSRINHTEVPASDTGWRMILWLFSNGSAEANIYQIGNQDPPQNTQALQWRIVGATLTMTLYGETIYTLQYDGTYLILEQKLDNGDVDSMIFEKTGE